MTYHLGVVWTNWIVDGGKLDRKSGGYDLARRLINAIEYRQGWADMVCFLEKQINYWIWKLGTWVLISVYMEYGVRRVFGVSEGSK